MALIAGGAGMRAEQGEARAAVIKRAQSAGSGHRPAGDHTAVTLLATQGKARLAVIRICGGLVILAVAHAALQRQVHELHRALLRMAIIAAHMLVPA